MTPAKYQQLTVPQFGGIVILDVHSHTDIINVSYQEWTIDLYRHREALGRRDPQYSLWIASSAPPPRNDVSNEDWPR